MTNEALVSRIVDHKEVHLFELLYERFSHHVYNKCYSFVKNEDEAKDLAQDIFLKLYLKLPSFEGKSKFSTWIYSLTYNHCVNYVNRNAKRKYESRMPETFDFGNYAEEIDDSNEFSEKSVIKLSNALKDIPENDRSILELKYQKNLSVKNIESVLGIGGSAVKMRIKRAKERLACSYALAV
ncbi:RNA polymerase sigma factor [Algibacter sp.]|uniref:RNA polymerase sigma factor n=1 Tax=Algibacter sp. TaxID=1872428 RepID=UPI003C716259